MNTLAWLFRSDNQLDAAEDAAFRAINFLPETGQQYRVCESHTVLGWIYRSKGETKKVIHHFEVALEIASTFNWHVPLCSAHYGLTWVFLKQDRLNDAQAHVELAKSHAVDGAYYLGLVTELQARVWCRQRRLEEARTEALRAVDIYDKLGASMDAKRCKELLDTIELGLNLCELL